MKIQAEIDIFDDPEKCGNCGQLDDERGPWLCGWSRQYLEEDEQSNPLKCDQCKAEYQKAKLEEPADSIKIDGYSFDCQKERLFFMNRVEAVLICNKAEKKRIQNMLESKQTVAISSYDGFMQRIGSIEVIELFPAANNNVCLHIISRSK